MPDGYGVKDLPEAGVVVDSKKYLVEGKWLNVIFSVLNQLWRGENVGKGPNIRIRQLGLGGYSISGADQPGGGPAAPAGQHAYTVYDASVGASPMIGVTPGTHNGVTPTIYSTPINTQTGMPPAYPLLTLGSDDTVIYFEIDYDDNGNIDTIEISSTDADGWSGLQADVNIQPMTAGTDCKMLSTVAVSFAAGTGNASVKCNNDVVSGPQGYQQCQTTSSVWLV